MDFLLFVVKRQLPVKFRGLQIHKAGFSQWLVFVENNGIISFDEKRKEKPYFCENKLVDVQTTKCLYEGVNTYAAMTTGVY